MDEFCNQVEDGIDTASLRAGATYQGVVTAMNRAKGELTVRVGDRIGTLSRKNMAWAGKVNLVEAYGKPKGQRGKCYSLGSVIEVSVLTPDVNKAGAVFALDQEPEAQAALFAMDPKSGAVRAMVGGYDFKKSQFNRAMQARRNAGSAFKPIIYCGGHRQGDDPGHHHRRFPGGIRQRQGEGLETEKLRQHLSRPGDHAGGADQLHQRGQRQDPGERSGSATPSSMPRNWG